jgi:hypothetical protein
MLEKDTPMPEYIHICDSFIPCAADQSGKQQSKYSPATIKQFDADDENRRRVAKHWAITYYKYGSDFSHTYSINFTTHLLHTPLTHTTYTQ